MWVRKHSTAPENTAHRDEAPILACCLEAKFQQTNAAPSEMFILLLDLLSDPVHPPQSGDPT